MAFSYTNSKGRTYYLHAKEVALRGGRQQTIYYFSKEVKPGALHVLPSGKIVVENGKTGLPILKGSEKKQGIGNSDVMTREKVKINEQVKVEQEPQKPETEMKAEEKVEGKTKIEDKKNKAKKTALQPKHKSKANSFSKNGKVGISILPLVMLPGQLFVIATAKLLMNRLSKNPVEAKTEEE